VGGTNGKGSTAAILASILGEVGLRVGLMPSPHLSAYTERVQVGLRPITEAEFAEAVSRVRPALARVAERHGPPTEFEALTAVAIEHLATRVDRLVFEVGLGGRLDATNVLDLGNAVVTNVALDHQEHLGTTVAAIAREKAGIVKPRNSVVTGCQGEALRVVEAAARLAGARLWRLGHELRHVVRPLGWEGVEVDVAGPEFEYEGLRLPLLGAFQGDNAALAVSAAHAMGDAWPVSVPEGVARARWPGRLELVRRSPLVVLDGAHNPAAAGALASELVRLQPPRPLVLLFAAMRDKAVAEMLGALRRLHPDSMIVTAVESHRAAAPADLARAWPGPSTLATPSDVALQRAVTAAGAHGSVVACGSLYLVGELRPLLTPEPA
jgi:dihydrofolate synthase/folylpolyglutamate synthase